MALLGLLLLPSNFRAGEEVTHGHSLLQLWADAADGHIDHHHHHHPTATNDISLMDWLGPTVDTASPGAPDRDGIDVGSQNDSAPVPGIVHLLPVTFITFIAVADTRRPTFQNEQTLVGCCPEVLLPPPR